MSKLSDLLTGSEYEIEAYLENILPNDFKRDITNLMQEYSDNGAIDKAIKFLQECKS